MANPTFDARAALAAGLAAMEPPAGAPCDAWALVSRADGLTLLTPWFGNPEHAELWRALEHPAEPEGELLNREQLEQRWEGGL